MKACSLALMESGTQGGVFSSGNLWFAVKYFFSYGYSKDKNGMLGTWILYYWWSSKYLGDIFICDEKGFSQFKIRVHE